MPILEIRRNQNDRNYTINMESGAVYLLGEAAPDDLRLVLMRGPMRAVNDRVRWVVAQQQLFNPPGAPPVADVEQVVEDVED